MEQDLKAKFKALREFVETIPAEKLDMYAGAFRKTGCGCVIAHARKKRRMEYDGIIKIEDHFGKDLPYPEVSHLFNGNLKSYPIPTGQPAKDEFLRRLDVLKEKYCGSSKESPS